MSTPLHTCSRCGASCQGLRARVRPDERDALITHAARLGIERPLDGHHLRQNWGRCVFLSRDGCRLHATFGPHAKPWTCRTFPRVADRIDPACHHPGEVEGPAAQVDWACLDDGRRARSWLDALVLPALLDGPLLGPAVAARLQPLVRAVPAVVPPEARSTLAIHFATLRDLRLVPQRHPVSAAHGGAQLLASVDALEAFPAWVRLLKLGLFGCAG